MDSQDTTDRSDTTDTTETTDTFSSFVDSLEDPYEIIFWILIVGISIGIIYIIYQWVMKEEPTYHLVTPEQIAKYRDHVPRFTFDNSDIYFINLDRATRRRDNVYKQFKDQGLNGQRFPAVNGQEIHLDDPSYQSYLRHMKWWYEKDHKRKGHFACFLSHMKIYETFLQSDKEYCLIFEDDVEFLNKTFKRDVMNHMRHVPEDWDIVLFGYHIDDSDRRVKKGNAGSRLIHNILNITYFTGLHGYMINKRSAQILYSHLRAQKRVFSTSMGCIHRSFANPRSTISK